VGKATWGLPEGSIRALLVLLVTATACGLFYLGRPVPDLLAKLTEDGFLFYFLTRGIQWQAERTAAAAGPVADPDPLGQKNAPDPEPTPAGPPTGTPPG
jgi:hypothetical protein